MSFKQIVAIGACSAWMAWSCMPAMGAPDVGAGADAVPLSQDQARALGVRFTPIGASGTLKVGTHARVVFKPGAEYVVAAPYAGIVSRVLASVGQTVRQGEPVATFLSPQLLEASRALAEADSQARLARQSLARDKALYDDGIIARSRWEATQARAAEADAAVRARRGELASAGVQFSGQGGEARLLAGRGGVVSDVTTVPGARVDAAMPLFRIVDPSALELDLLVGRDIPVPVPGDRIANSQRGASGRVIGVAPLADGTGGVRVRASLERRGDLRAGESVNVTLETGGPAGREDRALVQVPLAALVYVRGAPGIFVATDKGVRFQPVAVASTDDAVAVVRASLPAGTRVAVAGLGALKGLVAGEP